VTSTLYSLKSIVASSGTAKRTASTSRTALERLSALTRSLKLLNSKQKALTFRCS